MHDAIAIHTLATPRPVGGDGTEALTSLLAPTGQGLVLTPLSDVKPQPVEWLWPGYVPQGKLTLLVGDPGTGKSFVTHDWTARITSGKAWPDGAAAGPVGDVVLLQAEDDPADTIRPRLDALGADPHRAHVVSAVRRDDGTEALFALDRDISRLAPLLKSGRIRLLVIDPLAAYLGPSVDTHKDSNVRRVLAPLADLAAKTGVAVVAVMHLNKKQDLKAIYRSGGSIAFTAAARMVLAVAKDPSDPERRILTTIKMNIARPPKPLAFRITEEGSIAWDGTVEDVDVEQLLDGAAPTHRQPVKLEAAIAFLQAQLASGPVLVNEIQTAARRQGHAWPTVERAKRVMRIETIRPVGGACVWSLCPEQPINPSERS